MKLITLDTLEVNLDEFYINTFKRWKYDCINPMNKKDFDYNLFKQLKYLYEVGEFPFNVTLTPYNIDLNIYYKL